MKAVALFGLIICVFSSNSFAGDYSCPETHPEYNKILKELQAFQKKIKEKLDCEEMGVNFEKLTGLLGEKKRNDILSLVSGGKGQALNAESAQKIQDYASAVTEEVGVLVSLVGQAAFGELSWYETIMGTDRCSMSEEDGLDGIERLTKAAYEATNLISKVSGPYGVPLQVGVNVAYGVVQGLQTYAKRNRNIDFDTFEKRQFFESAVCIMSKFDGDIRKLNNPDAYLRNLRAAKAQARRVVRVVGTQCADCKAVLNATSIEDAERASQNLAPQITLMGQKAYESRANLEWIDKEIKKFNEIVNFKTGGIGPRELQSLKIRINDYILNTAAPDFLKWYTSKAAVSGKQVGRSIASALKQMREDVEDSGMRFNYDLPTSIEKELEVDLTTYRGVLAASAARNFRRSYAHRGGELLDLFWMKSNQSFVERPSFSYYSKLGEVYDVWKLSDFNVRIVQEYCSFFENTFQYTQRVEGACESQKFLWHGLRVGYQSFYLASLINEDSAFQRLGPFDFRLEDHMSFIERFEDAKEGVSFHIAKEGINLVEVLERDRGVRQKDGRWNPYGNEFYDAVEWWQGTEGYANDFINEFMDLR